MNYFLFSFLIAEALTYYGSRLNKYERAEVAQYPQVWYLGLDASKIDGELRGAQNCGYDDDNGSYIKVLHDHIAYRYEILEVIGKGSFGQVIRVLDHKTDSQISPASFSGSENLRASDQERQRWVL
ncbi:dual specificity tyrosine-phosphorylation-regulated kinase 4 [Caerostris extrusa]|uniref:dual-specificity kinase n=1 Tax=Caerostris extrusa TaxID=172846 RepID=A0AAV4TLF7_CAEEX|nr:dual specificity tyrosine-phosphorylation-regulated kinase 4 [Caerostris extrusa]